MKNEEIMRKSNDNYYKNSGTKTEKLKKIKRNSRNLGRFFNSAWGDFSAQPRFFFLSSAGSKIMEN